MAFVLEPIVFASWAVSKRNMIIGNIVEEMDLILLKHESCSNGVNRSVTPSFIEESPITIK